MLGRAETLKSDLETHGVLKGDYQLHVTDVINAIDKNYADDEYIYNLPASVANQETTADADYSLSICLRNLMHQAINGTSDTNVLVIVYEHHYYLASIEDSGAMIKLHDVREDDPRNLNQQRIKTIFQQSCLAAASSDIDLTSTRGQILRKTVDELTPATIMQAKNASDVQWDGNNCGDLIIQRALELAGNAKLANDPRALRRAVVEQILDEKKSTPSCTFISYVQNNNPAVMVIDNKHIADEHKKLSTAITADTLNLGDEKKSADLKIGLVSEFINKDISVLLSDAKGDDEKLAIILQEEELQSYLKHKR